MDHIESFCIILKKKKFKNLFRFFLKSKVTSSIMRNIVLFPFRFKFPVNLIWSIVFGSVSSACCLLKSIKINLQCSFKQGKSYKHSVV